MTAPPLVTNSTPFGDVHNKNQDNLLVQVTATYKGLLSPGLFSAVI